MPRLNLPTISVRRSRSGSWVIARNCESIAWHRHLDVAKAKYLDLFPDDEDLLEEATEIYRTTGRRDFASCFEFMTGKER